MARWLVALLCLASCDKTWGLVHLEPSPVDAQVDDGPVDAPVDGRVDGPVDALPACPPSYTITVSGSTSQYRYRMAEAIWTTAETLCEEDEMGIARHTHLVVLGNDTERSGLYAKLKTAGITKNAWIGLTDLKTEGTFRWVTTQMVNVPPNGQPPWSPGQPDNNTGNADCVRMIAPNDPNEGKYDDVECGAAAGFEFVCECDDFPAAPANF